MVAGKFLSRIKNNRFIQFLQRVIKEFLEDNCPLLAAAISFNLLFSLFPFVIAMISLASLFIDSNVVREQIIQGVTYIFSISSDFIANILNYVIEARGATGIISAVLLVFGGLAFFDTVRIALNKVWKAEKPQNFFKGHLLDMVMMFGMAILFIIASTIIVFIRLMGEFGLNMISDFPIGGLLIFHILIILLDILLLFVVFLLLYKFIPNMKIHWKDVWLGALIAAVFAEIANIAFTWFITNFKPYDLIYGPLGAVIALLFWAYLISVIGLLFAKISAVRLAIKNGN
jgi:membrane protein